MKLIMLLDRALALETIQRDMDPVGQEMAMMLLPRSSGHSSDHHWLGIAHYGPVYYQPDLPVWTVIDEP